MHFGRAQELCGIPEPSATRPANADGNTKRGMGPTKANGICVVPDCASSRRRMQAAVMCTHRPCLEALGGSHARCHLLCRCEAPKNWRPLYDASGTPSRACAFYMFPHQQPQGDVAATMCSRCNLYAEKALKGEPTREEEKLGVAKAADVTAGRKLQCALKNACALRSECEVAARLCDNIAYCITSSPLRLGGAALASSSAEASGACATDSIVALAAECVRVVSAHRVTDTLCHSLPTPMPHILAVGVGVSAVTVSVTLMALSPSLRLVRTVRIISRSLTAAARQHKHSPRFRVCSTVGMTHISDICDIRTRWPNYERHIEEAAEAVLSFVDKWGTLWRRGDAGDAARLLESGAGSLCTGSTSAY